MRPVFKRAGRMAGIIPGFFERKHNMTEMIIEFSKLRKGWVVTIPHKTIGRPIHLFNTFKTQLAAIRAVNAADVSLYFGKENINISFK